MKQLISSDNLNILRNEEGVLKFVLAWFNHDPVSRKEHYPDLMKNVRLPLVQRNLLKEILGSEFEQLKQAGEW